MMLADVYTSCTRKAYGYSCMMIVRSHALNNSAHSL